MSSYSEGLTVFGEKVVCDCCETDLGTMYGFMDINGNIVMKPRWSYVRDFSEGLAVVCRRSTSHEWSYIDKSGNIVFTVECGYAGDFMDGHAAIGSNGQNGLVDKKGNIIVELGNYDIFHYYEGEFFGLDGGWYRVIGDEHEKIDTAKIAS